MENKNKTNDSKKTIIIMAAVVAILVIAFGVFMVINGGGKSKIESLKTTNEEIQKLAYNDFAMMDIDAQILETIFKIAPSEVEEFYGKMPLMNVHASMYVVIKAKPDKVNDVKTKLEKYGEEYSKQWENYLPEQFDLVSNRKVGSAGDYVYMIVSDKAAEVEKLIK